MPKSAGSDRKSRRGFYVYAVARRRGAAGLDDVPGVDRESPVRVVEESDLAAIVSEVGVDEFHPDALDANVGVAWLDEKARVHAEVVGRVRERGAVLPMRFGTILASEDDVRGLLARHRESFADLLRRVEGKDEWGVKCLFSAEKVARWIRAKSPHLATLDSAAGEARGGRSYFARKQLERLLAAEVQRTVAARAHEAHERISACAAAARLNPPHERGPSEDGDEMVLNGAYLIPREREEELRALVAELGREYADVGIAFVLTGPWPAYNFVETATESGWTTS